MAAWAIFLILLAAIAVALSLLATLLVFGPTWKVLVRETIPDEDEF